MFRLPVLLEKENEKDRISIAGCFLSRQRNVLFLRNIITCDEKSVFYDNVLRKRQWTDEFAAYIESVASWKKNNALCIVVVGSLQYYSF